MAALDQMTSLLIIQTTKLPGLSTDPPAALNPGISLNLRTSLLSSPPPLLLILLFLLLNSPVEIKGVKRRRLRFSIETHPNTLRLLQLDQIRVTLIVCFLCRRPGSAAQVSPETHLSNEFR